MKTPERGFDLTSLQKLVDSLPALIFANRPDGYLDFCNQRMLDYVGLRFEDLEGWKWGAVVHPDDVTPLTERWQASLASGEPFECEARVRRADGEYRWMLHREVAVRDGLGQVVRWYGSSIDIEDRKRAEFEVRKHETVHVTLEAQLQATLNLIPVQTWYAAQSGALTFVNQRCADYLGLPSDHPLRFGIDTGVAWDAHIPLLHPDDQERSRKDWSTSLRTGSAGEGTFRLRSAAGAYRWFVSRAEPLRANDGTLLYWIGINLDIEERKQAEDAQRRAEAELQQARTALAHRQRISLLGEVAASLAHEIKQPIAAARIDAKVCLRALADDRLDIQAAREAAARMVKDAMSADEIVRRTTALYKKDTTHRERVNVNAMIREMVLLFHQEAGAGAIAIRTELAKDIPDIMADRVQLQQALMNLMLNAIEAMKDSGGELTITSQPGEGAELLISVSDTGVGLPAENPDQIFESFVTTKPHGTGMGLAITRSIVESHSGRLWAIANSGPGATFQFTLLSETGEQLPLPSQPE